MVGVMAGQPLEEPHPETIGIPDDWLEAFIVLIGNGYEGDEDGRFSAEIRAIHQMRNIDEREGRAITLSPEVARAEWARRRDPDGSKRRAAEIEALTAERAEVEEKVVDYRNPLRPLLRRLEKINARLAVLRED